MPIQTFNFQNLPIQKPDYSGIESLPGKLLQAYMAPELMKRQHEEQQQTKLMKAEDLRAKQLANKFYEDYKGRLADAQISALQAQAHHAMQPAVGSLAERQLAQQWQDQQGGGPDAEQFGQQGAPPSVPYSDMPNKNEQLDWTKANRAGLEQARNLVRADDKVDELRKIIAEYPDIAKTAAVYFKDPSTPSGFLSQFFTSEKERSAAQKIQKIASDLILDSGEKYGRNFTDAKLKIIEQAKPGPNMTPEAFNFMLDQIQKHTSIGRGAEKAYQWGLKNRRGIVPDESYFRSQSREFPEQEAAQNGFADDMVRVRDRDTGEIRRVSRQEAMKMGAK